MANKEYDVAVIGGGPGGYVAAITAAKKGLKTVLFERDKAGGTCLNRGCIPTKALLFCSSQYVMAKESVKYGVGATVNSFDYSAAVKHKNAVTDKLRSGVEYLVKKSGCELIFANAQIKDEHTLSANGEEYSFKNLIIATGSTPAKPPFQIEEGAPVIDSDGFLALEKIPQRVIIVGGGVIGMEFATILCELEKEVVIVEALPTVLPLMDSELTEFAKKELEKKGVSFYTGTFVKAVSNTENGVSCTLLQGDKSFAIEADLVVTAAGRRANTAGLNLEKLSLHTEKGFIVIDDRCCTSIPHIFAVGDVNGRSMLAHAASHQGKTVAMNIAENKNIGCNFITVPGCVYTHPELAMVGLTEKQALEKGTEVKVGRFNGAGNGKLMTSGENNGFVKLVSDAKTGELLGGQLCCAHATDMIGEIVTAIGLESTVSELAKAIHPHPTVCEMIMEAADDCLGICVHQ